MDQKIEFIVQTYVDSDWHDTHPCTSLWNLSETYSTLRLENPNGRYRMMERRTTVTYTEIPADPLAELRKRRNRT